MNASQQVLHGLVLITALTLLGWLLGEVLDKGWIDAFVRGHGVTGELLFVGIGSLLISVGLSRQLTAFLAGYGFGFTGGFLLSMAAVTAGCVITFYCARLLMRGFLSRRFSAPVRRLDDFIREHTFATTLLFRLLPVGSNWMVNIAAGISTVRGVPFVLGSALGFVPQMAVFALAGSGSVLQHYWLVALATAMFVAVAVLGAWLFARFSRSCSKASRCGGDRQETADARGV